MRLSQPIEVVGDRFGKAANFRYCSTAGVDLDTLLHSLEIGEKSRITSDMGHAVGSTAQCRPENPPIC